MAMSSDRLTITAVDCNENINIIRELQKLLKSSMSPGGSAKAIVTGGGILQLSVSCSSLISRLELKHPVCRYIGHVASSLPDFGLYFAVTVSHLLEQLWSYENLSKEKLSSSVHILLEFIRESLKSEFVCRNVNFDSVSSFLPLVRTVITSKCPSFLFDTNLNNFCIEIVKTFLSCLDETSNKLNRAYVKVETGPNLFLCHKGLLYKINEDNDLKIINKLFGEIKIIIFTLKLENSAEEDCFSVVDQVIPILEMALELNVRIVACQKTVAAEIKLYLMRRKILVMDRMGTDLTETLLHTSQSLPISQLNLDGFDPSRFVGAVTSISLIEFNDSNYIALQNDNASVATLLIQNYWLGGADHAKESQRDKELLLVSLWLQRALLSVCGETPPKYIDSTYHHCWAEGSVRCNCGLIMESQESLIPLAELVNNHSSGLVIMPPPINVADLTVPPDVLVDSHQQKLNVIVSAMETFINLSDIGVIVFKE